MEGSPSHAMPDLEKGKRNMGEAALHQTFICYHNSEIFGRCGLPLNLPGTIPISLEKLNKAQYEEHNRNLKGIPYERAYLN